MDAPTPMRRPWLTHERAVLLVVAIVMLIILAWVAWQATIVHERRAVAKWIDQRNRDALSKEFHGVEFFGSSSQSNLTEYVRTLLGDRQAAWVQMVPPITEEERDRIARAFPEAQQFLRVEEPSPAGPAR
jgi:hypothetical protein